MFDELSARFEDAVKGLRGQDQISETNVQEALKEVRRALLEADVSLPVVKEFVEEVRQKAVGEEVVRGLNPDQKFIQVVHQQLVEVMGGDNAPLASSESSPTVVLMTGLQGAGKTTATAKLGLHLKDQGKTALMVAADVYRPAAIDQLRTLGEQINIEVFTLGTDAKPEDIALAGLEKARAEGIDTVLVDTAGRLQIDAEMMDEMVRISSCVEPDEVLLVVDSMIGQEAADLTRVFHEKVGITGAVLTKLDGDSRGGGPHFRFVKSAVNPSSSLVQARRLRLCSLSTLSGWLVAFLGWAMYSPLWRKLKRKLILLMQKKCRRSFRRQLLIFQILLSR